MTGLRLFARNDRARTARERSALRSLLRSARQENRESYLALVASYLNLVNEYFGTTLEEPPAARIDRCARLFAEIWQCLRYTDRLSDFEYLVARALIEAAPGQSRPGSDLAMAVKCRLLHPGPRFALAAYEFEGWQMRHVALALRTRPAELHRLLSEARCELCGVSWESLSSDEQDCLVAISHALDRGPDLKTSRSLCKRTAAHPRIAEIKAHWLELRPELVEVRLRFRPDEKQREALLAAILGAVDGLPMHRAKLVQRLVNSIHFSRHPEIKVG